MRQITTTKWKGGDDSLFLENLEDKKQEEKNPKLDGEKNLAH